MINFFSKLLFKLQNILSFKKINSSQFFLNKKSKTGFTLLEMSVTILILSIIMVAAISFQVFTDENSKENITADRIKRIEQAIWEYSLKNEKLPCPSDLTLSRTNANYGKELRSSTGGNCEVADSQFLKDGLIYGGVPTKTLGLTSDYAVDAWNSKIAYIISKGYGDNKISLAGDSETLNIQNTYGTEISSRAVYALISGGKNKNGVFRDNGAQSDNNISLTDNENVFSTNFNNIFIKDINTNSFDDIVVFKNKDALVFKDDMETLPCTLKDLRELDSNWNYTSHDSCNSSGICKQGTIIASSSECLTGISKNPQNISEVGTSYRPVRKCLKYGQWSNIIFPCVETCGESNIGDIDTDRIEMGKLGDYISLNYLDRIKLNESVILECIGERVGYIKLKCEEGRVWNYTSGDCYEAEYLVASCQNNQLNNNTLYFTFTNTTGTTNSGGSVNGTCSTGYYLQGEANPIATCQNGVWNFSGGPCIVAVCQNNLLNSNTNNFTFTGITGTTAVGGISNGACSTGYVLQGGGTTPTATCQANGTWGFSGGPCALPGGACNNSIINNNTVNFIFPSLSPTGTTTNGTTVHNGECKAGYNIFYQGDYDLRATCNNGVWSYNGGPCLSSCQNSTLNDNPNHFYFTTTTGTTSPGASQYTSSCAAGYNIDGGVWNMIATCQTNGTFTFSGGPCVASCLNSQLQNNPNHYAFSYSGDYTGSGVTLWGNCAPGYVRISGPWAFNAICSNGVWTYSGGVCGPQ